MNESHGHGSRIAAVVFGFLLAGAALLWLLFWLFGLAWFWPPELGTAVFLGVCVGLGIVALLVGVFCMVVIQGGQRGWLQAGAAALTPVGVLAPFGLTTRLQRERSPSARALRT